MDYFHNEIPGWFDFDNIYKVMVDLATPGSHFVEVGSWKGKSAAFMCIEIANSSKDIKFDCVDIWTGAGVDGEYDADPSVKTHTLYEEFLAYMKPAEGLYTPIKEWSDKAAALYADASLDFVFIDAGHDYGSAPGVNRAVNELVPGFTVDGNSWVVQVK